MRWTLCVVLFFLVLSCTSEPDLVTEMPSPPMAKARPVELEAHGHVRVDPYYWLRERDNPEVLRYLEDENAHTAAVMSHTMALQDQLFAEMRGRIQENDSSVPVRRGDYWYYTRFVEGGEYPLYCRKKSTLDAPEEVMLDGNAMAVGLAYFAVRGVSVSTDQSLLVFAIDTIGRRIYTIRFLDLRTGEHFDDELGAASGNLAWANDNRTLFYTQRDPKTLRSYRIYRHVLGTAQDDDVLVFEETDETFDTAVWKTKSKRFMMIGSSHTLANEVRFLAADRPTDDPRVLLVRERGHEYSVGHLGDHFYLRSNKDARNFRLMRTPVDDTDPEAWTEVVPHREDTLLVGFELFRDFLVISERRSGLLQLRIREWSGEEHELEFDEPAYTAAIGTNPEIGSTTLRFVYSSMTTPRSTFDYDMKDRSRKLRKQQPVLGGFNAENYRTERLHATARDGARVPISLVYREGFEPTGRSPLLLYAYGAYGSSIDASFDSRLLSLLDRGFVYAVAHVRGGQELGRDWYESGKLLAKKNTFTDFIDCGEFLVEQGFADPKRLYARGGSAGGLLMGAIANMRPELFDGVVAQVPFVDVLTTMADASIPLTSFEWDEWGDPRQKENYEYMLSYSPYDRVEAKAYPHLLVTAGLHDSQVQYWEPAKWVAKLRATQTGDRLLLLRTEMEAGHGGASGRFRSLRELAFIYAFLLDLADAA